MQMSEQPFGRYNVRATQPVGQVYIFGLVHWVHLHGGENVSSMDYYRRLRGR